MAIPSTVIRQRDFSSGQISATAKRRDDEEVVRAGLREAKNVRILASGAIENRPGRSLRFQDEGRTEAVRMNSSVSFYLCFGDGAFRVRDGNGAVVFERLSLPWTVLTVDQISWARFGKAIVVCFPAMVTQVAIWDGASTWTMGDFAFATSRGDVLQQPFYRFADVGVTLTVSAKTGTITVTSSAPFFGPQYVGTRMTWMGGQIMVTAYTSPTEVTATAMVELPATVTYTGTTEAGSFLLGDVSSDGSISAQVVDYTGTTLTVNHLNAGELFAISGVDLVAAIIGPNGKFVPASRAVEAAGTSTIWEESLFSQVRGWPRSCSTDQNRLIFCDIPSLEDAVLWSKLGVWDGFEIGASPTDAIFEIAPRNSRVLHVIGGADQFVLTDQGVMYVPISESNPLRPGSVSFREITAEPAAPVRPAMTQEGIVYVNAGRNRITAIRGTGQTARPWVATDITELHSDLIIDPRCIAATTGSGDFPERYVMVANGDGSLAVGRYQTGKEWVGWVPWDTAGGGRVSWVSVATSEVLFTTRYNNGPTADSTLITADSTLITVDAGLSNNLVEVLDGSAYLDGQIMIADPPPALVPPPGMGPYWFIIGSDVQILDGHRLLALRHVDANGDIELQEGDDFSSETLSMGRAWTMTVEPFLPHVQPGSSVKQTLRRRRVKRGGVTVKNSSGFVAGTKRFTPYRQGENEAAAPPLREETCRFPVLGRSFDPRVPIVKDTPGPLQILEISLELTV